MKLSAMPSASPNIAQHDITRIELTSPRQRFFLFATGFWLFAWGAAEVVMVREFLAGQIESSLLVAFGWFLGWTLTGAVTFYTWLWYLCGKEIITIDSQILTIRREVFGVGTNREFPLSKIRNLEIASANQHGIWQLENPFYLWAMRSGTISFQVERIIYRFALSCDPTQAQLLIEKISFASKLSS